MHLDDFEGTWNWIYMGYSYKLEKARAFVFYSRSRNTNYYEWNECKHNLKLDRLNFIVGRYLEQRAMNGFYYDLDFKIGPRNDEIFKEKKA